MTTSGSCARATNTSKFQGPIQFSQGLCEGFALPRWTPKPFQAGLLEPLTKLLCQPGPHQWRWENACTFQPSQPSTAAEPSSRKG